MLRIGIEAEVDGTDESTTKDLVDDFLARLGELGAVTVYRSAVTPDPDPDAATDAMLEGYRGGR